MLIVSTGVVQRESHSLKATQYITSSLCGKYLWCQQWMKSGSVFHCERTEHQG